MPELARPTISGHFKRSYTDLPMRGRDAAVWAHLGELGGPEVWIVLGASA